MLKDNEDKIVKVDIFTFWQRLPEIIQGINIIWNMKAYSCTSC